MTLGVVIVTYNRIQKLQKCLDAYAVQSYLPQYIMVIDNASTDGTLEYLDNWVLKNQENKIKKEVIHCSDNIGGAGGFAKGLREMTKKDVDWIWLADDDAYPDKDCLHEIVQYYSSLSNEEICQVTAMCGKVVDGKGISALHRRQLFKTVLQIKERPLPKAAYLKKFVDIDFFSFVGTAIKKKSIQEIGFPRDDFFIFYDDSEYSLRLRKKGQIKCIPTAVIFHDSQENIICKYTWKNYYMFRNKMYIYKHYFSKRYYFVEQVKIIYMVWKYYNTFASWKQLLLAQHDCRKGVLGKCAKYMP